MPRRSEFRLTKRTVDALETQGKDALYWDRDLAGFGVRVHATGRKSYIVQSRGPGGVKRVTLGRHGEMSCEEARKQATFVIGRIKGGEDPSPKPPETELTVAELAERFMSFYVERRLKPGSVVEYRTMLAKHVLPFLGGMALSRVGRAEVSAFHHSLRDMPSRANTSLHILSRMFNLAEAWDLVPPGRNPCRGVPLYRTRSRERFLTTEEYRRLGRTLKEAEANGSIWPPAIKAIQLLMLTGCRVSEILNLRWDDVDLTGGVLRLRDAKAGPRMVPLPKPVRRVLDTLPRQSDNPWVIVGQKPGKNLKSLYHYWQPIRARAGLDDVRIHDLRHSFASRALTLGESLYTIGKLLGHATVTTTARYTHLMLKAEKEAASRVGGSIGVQLMNGKKERR